MQVMGGYRRDGGHTRLTRKDNQIPENKKKRKSLYLNAKKNF